MNLPETKIRSLKTRPGQRILVTGDLHGHPKHLEKVLEKAGFCKDDLLIILGDVTEKGPDSLGALRKVMSLCEGGNAVCLIGNVDAWRLHIIYHLREETAEDLWNYILSCRTWWGTSFYEELASECGYALSCKEDVLAAKESILAHFEKELEFLASLPTVLETEDYIFVHGGLKEKVPAENTECSVFELTKYDAFAEKTTHCFDKWVVVGHWPVALYGYQIQQYNPLRNAEKRILSIDGGCGVKSEGQLNLVILQGDEVSFVAYDDLPKLVAKEDQEASKDPLFISWVTRRVEILEKSEDFSLVRHLHSGRVLEVPTSLLYGDGECMDYSDYVLPVKKGEMLSLVQATPKGCIVKKDGVVGWYYGAFEELPS